MDMDYPDEDDSFKGETVWADGSEFELSWEEDTPKSTATSATEPLQEEEDHYDDDDHHHDEVKDKFWGQEKDFMSEKSPADDIPPVGPQLQSSQLADDTPDAGSAHTNLTNYCHDVTCEETVDKFSPFSANSSPSSFVPPSSPSRKEPEGEKEDVTTDLLVTQIKFLEDIIRRENGEILRLRSIQDFHLHRCEPSLLSHTQPFTAALISYHEAVLKRILIQRHILLLLHASKCLRKEEEAKGKRVLKQRCDLSHCPVAKDLLRHMFACRRGKMCPVAHCFPSRQMIFHWKTCQQKLMEKCQICSPLRRPRPSTSPSSSLTEEPRSSSSSIFSSPQPSPSFSCQSVSPETSPSKSDPKVPNTPTVVATAITTNTKNGRHGYDLRKTRANGHHDDGGSVLDKTKLKYFKKTSGKRDHYTRPPVRINGSVNNRPMKRILPPRQAKSNADRIKQILKMATIEEAECEEDDPNTLWCICRQPHKNKLMIQCDDCLQWFHSSCVAVSKAQATKMEKDHVKWVCPLCRSRVDK